MKKFINNVMWFLLGVAATIFAIVIYAANNGGINNTNDEVYEDSLDLVRVMSQINDEVNEDTSSLSLRTYVPVLKTYFVNQMLEAGAKDSINASAFVQELIDELLPDFDRQYKQFMSKTFTPGEIRYLSEFYNSELMSKYMYNFEDLNDSIQTIVRDPRTFEKVKSICKKYGY